MVCDAYTIWSFDNNEDELNKFPSVWESYHLIFWPVAVRSETIDELQKDCELCPVGESIELTEVVTANLESVLVLTHFHPPSGSL